MMPLCEVLPGLGCSVDAWHATSDYFSAAVIPILREAIRKLDPELVMTHGSTTDGIISRSLAGQHFAALLMTGFAALGLVLATVGVSKWSSAEFFNALLSGH